MADDAKIIDEAVEKFRALMESQLARAKKIKEDKEFTDYDALDTIVIGIHLLNYLKNKSKSGIDLSEVISAVEAIL